MKNLLILILSLFFAGCAIGSAPEFPDTIKFHYMVDVQDTAVPEVVSLAIVNPLDIPASTQVVRCLKFDIISKVPYRIKFNTEVLMSECQGVGGYKPNDALSLYNWLNDLAAWVETRKKCFK